MKNGTIPLADMSLTLVPAAQGAKIAGGDGAIHYLNQTAAAVWLLADGSRDADAIAAEIARIFLLSEPPPPRGLLRPSRDSDPLGDGCENGLGASHPS